MRNEYRKKKNKKELRNYAQYYFCGRDWIEYSMKILLKTVVICYLFYDSYKAVFLMLPFVLVDYYNLKTQKLEGQKQKLTLQFKSMIESLVTSLNAGYSLERAFEDARKDLSLLYDKKAYIFQELDIILSGLKMNISLELLLKDFGERSGVDDIKNFANVVIAAKQSGGNLIQIIQKTVNCITDKMAVEEEIETLIAAKKLEERIMMLMPYGIIFYLRISNGEFLTVLYHNLPGGMLMTLFLFLIYAADMWASSIMEIQV